MFKCMDCENEFAEPYRYSEYGIHYACPCCHSEDIQENSYEDVYGEYVYPGDTYYKFGRDVVLEKNIEDYLSSMKFEA